MSKMSDSSKSIVIPGENVGTCDKFTSGNCTYVIESKIYSSILGYKQINDSIKPQISVIQHQNPSIVPQIGDVVYCKVIKSTLRFAIVDILGVGFTPLSYTFPGKIRVQDVRAFEIDDVKIYKSFRPGDIVRAKVLSLGDKRSYYLTTAENDLGVIIAYSDSGIPMIPINWQQMQCPKTKTLEYRKVCKPSNI